MDITVCTIYPYMGEVVTRRYSHRKAVLSNIIYINARVSARSNTVRMQGAPPLYDKCKLTGR
jgi:hypothetical protein